jgi:retron-type reverse transcriptase
MIPKANGKLRRLGIATVTDRVVQASLKLVLIFEADFLPCCYGFRPKRRAQDAVAEVRNFTARSYEGVVEGDIEACFDEISDPGLMGRVRRIGDKRVLANVESKLIAHRRSLSRRSASRFAGCIGTFERRQRTRIDLSGSSAGDDHPLTRCPVAAPFALLSAARWGGRPPL